VKGEERNTNRQDYLQMLMGISTKYFSERIYLIDEEVRIFEIYQAS